MVPTPSFPWWLRAFDAVGEAGRRVGLQAGLLDAEVMLERAAAAEGHAEFGAGTAAMLATLVGSLQQDARLAYHGRLHMDAMLRGSLQVRLRLEAARRRSFLAAPAGPSLVQGRAWSRNGAGRGAGFPGPGATGWNRPRCRAAPSGHFGAARSRRGVERSELALDLDGLARRVGQARRRDGHGDAVFADLRAVVEAAAGQVVAAQYDWDTTAEKVAAVVCASRL